MWKVIQTRHIRGSSQNFSNELGEFRRKKQAIGEVKHQLNSHVDMLIKHEAPDEYEDVTIVEGETFREVSFLDGQGVFYSARYEAVEVTEEQPVKKFNLLAELEQIIDDYDEFHDGKGELLFDMLYSDLLTLIGKTKRK